MIVPVNKNDQDTLSAFQRLGEDYWSSLPDTHRGRFIQSVINRVGEPDRWLFLLKHEKEYIGFTHFKIDQDDKPGWGLLMELYIIPDKHRLGWGRKLYKHIERILREQNVQNIWLTTDPKAEAFWFSIGFTETGIIDERNNLKIMTLSLE